MNTENAVLLSSLISVNVRHDFSEVEQIQQSHLLAKTVKDCETEEANKKVAMSVFKNKIDTLQGQINTHASNINHGFTYVDKATVLYRDFDNKRRVYFDKQSGDYLKDEPFHAGDFQKALEFETEENARQEQIAENNEVGSFAEGETLAQSLYNPVDEIIVGKKTGKPKKEKPTPKDNLHPMHGANLEAEEDDEDIF